MIVRVRFAPSPTGNLHIGGVRTALFNYLFAKNKDGKFLLRIEDTDRERSKKEYIDNIFSSFKWLGLDFDEKTVFQSQRMKIYEKYFEILKEKGFVYPCFCSKEKLEKMRREFAKNKKAFKYPGLCKNLTNDEIRDLKEKKVPYVYRLNVGKFLDKKIKWNDLIRGRIEYPLDSIDDFIIRRSDGSFTYNFCVVVDDCEMNITHVIRGEDHISNTPKQILLYKAFEKKEPFFAHIPLILAPDRKKLSKRHGDVGLNDFINKGYVKEAIINYLALLGWNYDGKREIFDLEELISVFSLEKVNKSPAIFDYKKLNWFNSYYIRNLPVEKVFEYAVPFFKRYNFDYEICENEKFYRLFELQKERSGTLEELARRIKIYYCDDVVYDEKSLKKALKKYNLKKMLIPLFNLLKEVDFENEEMLEKILRDFAEKNGYKFLSVAQNIRLVVCGDFISPPIFEFLKILGKEKVIKKYEKLIKFLKKKEKELGL